MPFLRWLYIILLHFSHTRPILLNPSSAPHFKTFNIFRIYFPNCLKFQ
jgi:hypothetical protein